MRQVSCISEKYLSVLYTNGTNKLWYFNITVDTQQWSKIQIYVDMYAIEDILKTSTSNGKGVFMHITHNYDVWKEGQSFSVSHIWPDGCLSLTFHYASHSSLANVIKASVTIMAVFSPEFNPPFRWRCKHETKIAVHNNNLVSSEFLNRSNKSARSFTSTLNYT